MRTMVVAMAAVAALSAGPSWADRKVDEAVSRAEAQIDKGKPEEGVKIVEKVVSQNPTSPEAHAGLARVQARAGNLDAAATAAAKAQELSSASPPEVKAEVLTMVARLDLLRGSGRDAVTHAQEAVKLSETAATLASLARAQVRVQDPAAVATAEKAVQMGATSAGAQEALGQALLTAQRNDEAAAAFRKALELDPKSSDARVGLARALLAQGKAAEAVAEARKATEADPRSGEAFAVLGTAILAENKNNWGDAIAQAQQGAFLHPRNPVVQVAVGKLFDAGGNLDQATGAYRKALEADPNYIPARLPLLYLQMRKGETEAALVEARKLAEAMPQSGEVQLQLGQILLRKGEYVGAVEPLEKASAALPKTAEAHAMLGMARQYTGDSAGALEAYRKAVPLAPNDVGYRSTYGLLLGIADKYTEAVAELTKVVNSPGYKDTAGWTNLGWVYRNMEPSKPQEAVAAYRKALELDPKNAQAALGMGWALSYQRKYDEAIAAFQKALSLEPKTAGEVHNGIAWCHYFKNDLPKAKESAGKAKAEGRNVAGLLSNIDKKEKGVTQAQEEAVKAFREEQRRPDTSDDMGPLGNTLMHGNPAARRAAAQGLAKFGRPAVQFLVYAAVNDKDFGVREAAISSLGSIGGAAREACVQIRQIAIQPNPYDTTIQTREQMELSAKYEDLRRVAKAALSKIGC